VNQTNVSPQADKGEGKGHEVTVEVNGKPVVLPDNKVTGLEVKTAAKDQGVKIELDFLLTLEAEPGHPARAIADDEEVKANKHSRFRCNDGDDNS
jgi:hypothetical protein